MPDIVAQPPDLKGEVNPSVNDDNDAPVSESSIAENEDHREDEKRVAEPGEVLLAEGCQAIERDQLRRIVKQSRRMELLPELSREEEDTASYMQSRMKQARQGVRTFARRISGESHSIQRKAVAWPGRS